MLKNPVKKSFTLVELMIASAISVVALTVLISASIQIYKVFSDTSSDSQLCQYSDLVQKALIKKYQLREAVWKHVSSDSKIHLSYAVAQEGSESWPDTDNLNSIVLNYSEKQQNILVSGDGISEQRLLSDLDVKISKCQFEMIPRDPKDTKSVNRIQIQVEYTVDLGGKSYLRQEKFTTIIKNFES